MKIIKQSNGKLALEKNSFFKKAQMAGQAAGLIAIILLGIILYILFLPHEDRLKLLDESSSSSNSTSGSYLLTAPGTLEFLRETSINHTIPSFKLVNLENAKELADEDTIYVKNSWFSKVEDNFSFYIDKLSLVKNAMLTFNVGEASGELIIYLNEDELTRRTFSKGNIDPIELPLELLDSENILSFKVSPVGFSFWKPNKYLLSGIKVIGTVVDDSTMQSTSSFLVSSTEKSNIASAKLQYFLDCLSSTVGKLNIYVNDYKIVSQVPDCNSFSNVELVPEYLRSGENTITFKTDSGSYSIYGVYVNTELHDVTNPVYYFELDDDEYNNIISGTNDVFLKMSFADDFDRKIADIVVNSHMIRLDQKGDHFEENITDYIKRKTNSVKIIPKSILEVSELEIIKE